MEVRSLTLQAAVRQRIYRPARFFMLIETGGPLTVRLVLNDSVTREVGEGVERGYMSMPGDWNDQEDRFDAVEFESSTGQTIRYGVSERRGDYRSALADVRVEQADAFATADDEALTTAVESVYPSNANRHKLIVQHVAGAGVVRLGDALITATRGGVLKPNGSYTVHSKGELFARTESDVATLSFLEEVKS